MLRLAFLTDICCSVFVLYENCKVFCFFHEILKNPLFYRCITQVSTVK